MSVKIKRSTRVVLALHYLMTRQKLNETDQLFKDQLLDTIGEDIMDKFINVEIMDELTKNWLVDESGFLTKKGATFAAHFGIEMYDCLNIEPELIMSSLDLKTSEKVKSIIQACIRTLAFRNSKGHKESERYFDEIAKWLTECPIDMIAAE